MIATSDGGFLEVGFIYRAAAPGYNVNVIKFDSGGTIEWVGIYS